MALENAKNENFSEWYLEVVKKAELMDYSPVQGCMIIRPRAYYVWEKIQEFLNKKFAEDGVQNAYFPLFIPQAFLEKEAEHFHGFAPEVAWVTHGGDEALGEKLALRPTSETVMYDAYSRWISSHRDLPLKINQWCNVIRWDTKALKPFLRTREFLWQEGHTVHATKKEADAEVRTALNSYKAVCEELLAMPVVQGLKSDAEKFPGADYTTAVETLMPDGKALQAGTSHQLGQNFAKIFGVEFKTADGGKELAWQTSWGVSTRLIGGMVMLHSDDKGLVLPPKVAPLQVVFVPIYKTEEDRGLTLKACNRVVKKLGCSWLVDDSERTPGWKFNEWELKGVPVRVEIGLKDLAKQSVTIARRDTGEKEEVAEDKAHQFIAELLERIQENLFNKARKFVDENTREVQKFAEFKRVIEGEKGFIKAGWCGDAKCEEAIKEETGATIRVIPFEEDETPRKCVYCDRPAKNAPLFARSY